MSLENLINDLKQATDGKDLDSCEINQLVEGRVILPEDFEDGDVEFKDLNYVNNEKDPLYHLLIKASPEKSLDDVQPVLDEFFTRAKDLRLKRGVADVNYSLFWTPESFQYEKELTGLYFDEVKVKSRAYTYDPTKVRIGMNGQSHEIEATAQVNKMTLKATGNYRNQLESLIQKFNPQYVKLNLSKEDADKLLEAVENKEIGNYLTRKLLKKALKPKEMRVMNLIGNAVYSDTKEVIEPVVPIRDLQQYEKVIDKPLVAVSQEQDSHITEYIKRYGLGGLLWGERLSDLQNFAKEIPQMDLGIIYNHPVLIKESAKELLDAEIDIISDSYETILGLGLNPHKWRRGVVKRLAREHFGAGIIEGFDEAGVDQYIETLKSLGYEPAQSFKNELEYIFFGNESEHIEKERHLLEFFKQSYAKDPGYSVQRFRESYQNSEPKINISARGRKDASKLKKLKLPLEAELLSFGITEHMKRKTAYSNDLAIQRTLPSSDKLQFWSRTSIDSPILLPLQEYVCKEMGINFI